MSKLKVLTGILSGFVVCVLSAGCDSQVGDNYTGEPLLTIRGTIVQNTPDVSDLVPALGFMNLRYGAPEPPIYIVDGHVSGTFPSQFQFDVTDIPPEGVMSVATAPNRPFLYGYADLVMVPRDHDGQYDESQLVWNVSQTLGPAGSPPTTTLTACKSDSSLCRSLTYACTVKPCDVIYSSGDPALAIPENLADTETTWLNGRSSVTWSLYYDPTDISRSYREFRKCDSTGLAFPSSVIGGHIEECTFISETGDPSAAPTFVYPARDLNVLYVPEDEPDALIGRGHQPIPLTRGYNLLERLPNSPEDVVALANACIDQGTQIFADFNAANGTNCTLTKRIWAVGEPCEAQYSQIAYLWRDCQPPLLFRRIDPPGAELLTIWLSGKPGPQ